MYTVFVTGGIGSGKSTVSRMLAELGARTVDLDAIAREVLDEPQVKLALARQFGADVLLCPEGFDAALAATGSCGGCAPVDEPDPFGDLECGAGDYVAVNRPLLAARAFATPQDTEALNAITHPRILERLGALLTDVCCMGARARVTAVEVPLIEKVGPARILADEVIAVSCPRTIRRERAVQRGMAAEDFDARDACQADDEKRAAAADTVIANDGDAAALRAAVDAWWARRTAEGWRAREDGSAR